MRSASKSNETEGVSDDAKAAHYNASWVFKVPIHSYAYIHTYIHTYDECTHADDKMRLLRDYEAGEQKQSRKQSPPVERDMHRFEEHHKQPSS